jgi:hypothetical protein
LFPVTEQWTVTPASAADHASERATHVFGLVAGWLFSEPMAELLAAFGKRLPAAGSAGDFSGYGPAGRAPFGEELPEWLLRIVAAGETGTGGLSPAQVDVLRRTLAVERMAAGPFNFRARDGQPYRERSQAVAADFDPAFRSRVVELADQLGLVSPRQPQFARYDKTLILGGGHQFPLLRARYAAQLRAAGTDLGELSFLGSPRFLIEAPPERPTTDEYAPGAADEFDLMIAAARAEFGLTPAGLVFLCGCSSSQAQCPNWPSRHHEQAGKTPPAYTHERVAHLVDRTGRRAGSVLSASTSRPPLRPDTSDTFALWARYADPQPGQRVLAVTSQVFVPFQTFDGLRRLYLGHGVDVDVVGHSSEWGYPPQTAEYLLQETLSAIRSGRRLLVEATQALWGGSAAT